MNKQEIQDAINELHRMKKGLTGAQGCSVSHEEANSYSAKCIRVAISALHQQLTGGWIPVSSQIPERNGWYIVCDDENSISIVEFRNPWSIWYRKPNWDTAMEVIAWMPLPEPWKGEADETT